MKKSLLILLIAMVFNTAHAECPSDNTYFCSQYESAEQGDADAQYNLGVMYHEGIGVTQDASEAVRWTRKAAEQGYAEAQYNLGVMYANGKGVIEDASEAVRWYQKAAEQGDASAQYNLGVAYWNGYGVIEDEREAVRWYQKAAEQGYANAQYGLGLMYANGEGVIQDYSEAVRWTRKAAEQGDASAQYNLGGMYRKGEGVTQDASEAVRWYRKAAEQGVADAQFNLGLMYANGRGVTQDASEAVRWYRLAAEQGDASAQYNLGVMYWNGEGFITDEREAFIWFSIAKANGNELATNSLRENNWHLDAAEIKSARREAARRLRAIEQDIEQGKADSATNAGLDHNFALAEPSKSTNIAEQVFEKSWRSVVVIVNNDSQGSGVIVRPNVVATNCHVVDEGGDISVYKANNRRVDTTTPLTAVIRHSDTEQDFCLLEVDGLWGVPATMRKYETLRVGENVYSLGAPQGLDLSLSAGLVSQLRKIDGYQVVQTDAAISPGSSGGGLFDSDGNLVGITTFKFVDENVEGIGFAIPADLVFTR